ncbi:spore germination protein KC [Bacillus freudenreichii]|nr:spore germination protein KC [Bacillus freudenreichii]
MKRTFFIILCSLLLLTGCWNSQELDNVALVHGVGLDKSDDRLNVSVEIIKPTNQQGGQGNGQGNGQHIVLEKKADTLLEGARGLIRYAKRRLEFGHARVWLIGEKLAHEDFVHVLDVIRRDQMLRLNSYLFITNENPSDILNTSTLYENLTAIEIASALEQTQFASDYAPITLREFYKLLEGSISNAYVPMISIKKVDGQTVTSIDGTAVIKNNKMVGQLNAKETTGLNWLLDHVEGGSITVSLNEKEKVSLEINKAKTKTKTNLSEKNLHVDIQTKIEGTLADNVTSKKINRRFFKDIEKKISRHVENDIRSTLKKLQQELKTDITEIGPETYRTYPKQWQNIRSEWNDIFANAEVSIHIDANFTHEGLIKESVHREHRKPYNNPYPFSK